LQQSRQSIMPEEGNKCGHKPRRQRHSNRKAT